MRARGVAAATAVLCLLAVTSCGTDTARDVDPAGATPSSETPASQKPTRGSSPTPTAVPVADPDHAVPPPGALEDRLYRPDVLIFDQEPLSEDIVEQIR